MGNIYVAGSTPKQGIVEPRNAITLTISTFTSSLASEFKWKEAGVGSYTTAVSGTTPNTYILPANTWSRDKIMVWQSRFQDSGGWSDWYTFSVDTSGLDIFEQASSSSVVGLGPLGTAGSYHMRVGVRDGAGIVWGLSSFSNFTIHDSRSLVKHADGRWKGVPILFRSGGVFISTKAS